MQDESTTTPETVKPRGSLSGDSWFKSFRNNDALEIIATHPPTFILAYIIAVRARWKLDGFFRHNLQPGEAFLGDNESYGISPQEYRTAKKNLEQWGFATFKATNKGTIGKLINTRLFEVVESRANDQNNNQATTKTTTKQRTANKQTTTNLEGVERRKNVLHRGEGKTAPGSGPDASRPASPSGKKSYKTKGLRE